MFLLTSSGMSWKAKLLKSGEYLPICLQVRSHAARINVTGQDLERSAETAAHALAAVPSCKELKLTFFLRDSSLPSWLSRLNMALSCAPSELKDLVAVTVHYGDNLIW